MLRKAMHAGSWYPAQRSDIEEYFVAGVPRRDVMAVMSPHAGWQYSGRIAGELFSTILPAAHYVLIGPNHYGTGEDISVYPRGAWATPLGELPVNQKLAAAIVSRSSFARTDMQAHSQEHSLEVLMPFIKYSNPSADIVPIAMRDYSPDVCKDLGTAIADAITELNIADTTILVASSDMSHFISADKAERLDRLAIDRMLALDPGGLLETVRENNITMCGSGPMAAVLWAAKALGALTAELSRYTNSGDVTGDRSQVVAYAGILIPRGPRQGKKL